MYKYIFIDAQYILTRNIMSIRWGRPHDFDTITPSITLLFYSFAKMIREHYSVGKIILIWDKWPYHKSSMVDEYKGDRHYDSQEDIDELAGKDISELTPEELEAHKKQVEEVRLNVLANDRKRYAKSWSVKYFGQLGMPSILRPGYEADDMAYMASRIHTGKDYKIGLCSSDSDWAWFAQPGVDILHPKGEWVKTYEDAIEAMPKDLRGIDGFSPYDFVTYHDSLWGGHNNLQRMVVDPLPKGLRQEDIIMDHRAGKDISDRITDVPYFEKQLKTFKVEDYPDFELMKDALTNVDKIGSLMDPSAFFNWILQKPDLGIGHKYYSETYHSFKDHSLYNN